MSLWEKINRLWDWLARNRAVCRRAHVLFTLFVYSGIQHILCCVFVLFVFVMYLVCPMLPVSLDCPFLIAPRYSLTFTSQHVNQNVKPHNRTTQKTNHTSNTDPTRNSWANSDTHVCRRMLCLIFLYCRFQDKGQEKKQTFDWQSRRFVSIRLWCRLLSRVSPE
jgi:hypothetical protein